MFRSVYLTILRDAERARTACGRFISLRCHARNGAVYIGAGRAAEVAGEVARRSRGKMRGAQDVATRRGKMRGAGQPSRRGCGGSCAEVAGEDGRCTGCCDAPRYPLLHQLDRDRRSDDRSGRPGVSPGFRGLTTRCFLTARRFFGGMAH